MKETRQHTEAKDRESPSNKSNKESSHRLQQLRGGESVETSEIAELPTELLACSMLLAEDGEESDCVETIDDKEIAAPDSKDEVENAAADDVEEQHEGLDIDAQRPTSYQQQVRKEIAGYLVERQKVVESVRVASIRWRSEQKTPAVSRSATHLRGTLQEAFDSVQTVLRSRLVPDKRWLRCRRVSDRLASKPSPHSIHDLQISCRPDSPNRPKPSLGLLSNGLTHRIEKAKQSQASLKSASISIEKTRHSRSEQTEIRLGPLSVRDDTESEERQFDTITDGSTDRSNRTKIRGSLVRYNSTIDHKSVLVLNAKNSKHRAGTGVNLKTTSGAHEEGRSWQLQKRISGELDINGKPHSRIDRKQRIDGICLRTLPASGRQVRTTEPTLNDLAEEKRSAHTSHFVSSKFKLDINISRGRYAFGSSPLPISSSKPWKLA